MFSSRDSASVRDKAIGPDAHPGQVRIVDFSAAGSIRLLQGLGSTCPDMRSSSKVAHRDGPRRDRGRRSDTTPLEAAARRPWSDQLRSSAAARLDGDLMAKCRPMPGRRSLHIRCSRPVGRTSLRGGCAHCMSSHRHSRRQQALMRSCCRWSADGQQYPAGDGYGDDRRRLGYETGCAGGSSRRLGRGEAGRVSDRGERHNPMWRSPPDRPACGGAEGIDPTSDRRNA